MADLSDSTPGVPPEDVSSVFTPSPVLGHFSKLLSDLDVMIAAERRFETVAAELSLDNALRAAEVSHEAVSDGLTALLDSLPASSQDRMLQFGCLVLHCMMQAEDSGTFLRIHGSVESGRALPQVAAAEDAVPGQIEALLEALRRRIADLAGLACFTGASNDWAEPDNLPPDVLAAVAG